MKPVLIILLAQTVAILSCAPNDGIAEQLNSRFTEIDRCTEITNGDEAGEDWIAYKCEGHEGIPLWLTYADSARSYVGFGSRENLSGPFALDREVSWLVEWRGVGTAERFEPFAVIVRMVRPEIGLPTDGQGLLFVFRLREDGTSCMVASDLISNETAREIADDARHEFDCLSEPYRPGNS